MAATLVTAFATALATAPDDGSDRSRSVGTPALLTRDVVAR